MKTSCMMCLLFLAYSRNINSSLPPALLESERLVLRPVQISDLKDIANIALNPLVTEKTGFFDNVQTIIEVENFIRTNLIGTSESAPRYAACWVVVEKKSQKLIGLVSFPGYTERHQRAELAYVFAPDYWNHGYATETCQKIVHYALGIGVVRIQAVVDPENKAYDLRGVAALLYDSTRQKHG